MPNQDELIERLFRTAFALEAAWGKDEPWVALAREAAAEIKRLCAALSVPCARCAAMDRAMAEMRATVAESAQPFAGYVLLECISDRAAEILAEQEAPDA